MAPNVATCAFSLLVTFVCLTGCSAQVDESVESTIAAIDAIGEVTTDSAKAIDAAEKDYDALDDKQKEAVSNYDTLANARETYDGLLKKEASAVEEAIDNIGEVSLEKADAVNHADIMYKALSIDEKNMVSNYDVLKNAINTLNTLKRQQEEAAKALAVGDAVSTDRWNIVCSDAYVSTTLESPQSRVFWTADDSSVFLILEFDVEALTSDKLTIDDYAIVNPVATYNGNTYKSFDMKYVVSDLWLSAKRTCFEANIPVHIYVYAPLPAAALDDGKPISVDLTVAGQEKHLDVR